MNLYDMNAEMSLLEKKLDEFAAENEGDINDFPLLDELSTLEGDRDKKCLNIGCWIKNLKSKAAALQVEEKNLNGRRIILNNKVERLTEYVQTNLPKGVKLEDSRCVFSWRKSESVEVKCFPENLPEEYRSFSVSADKTELKKALKSGKKIKDVKLIKSDSLNIK